MKETHGQHKTKIDIEELITGPTNITHRDPDWGHFCTSDHTTASKSI
jgi:hypothetical protein